MKDQKTVNQDVDARSRLQQAEIDKARDYLIEQAVDRFMSEPEAKRLKDAITNVMKMSGREVVNISGYMRGVAVTEEIGS